MAISDTRYKDTDSQDVTCVCGKVSAELSGSPAMQLWCHCNDCRKWFQFSPVPIAVFSDQQVTLQNGEMATYSLTKPEMTRSFCKDCGHKFWNKHEAFQFHGVLATSVPNLKFEPQAHVYCADTTAEALKGFKNDGLPKFAQQQPVAGGDGRKIAL